MKAPASSTIGTRRGGGGGAARLQNEKGVILEVRAVKVGLEANLNLGGVTISMR